MPRIILVCNFADSLACIFWKYEKKKYFLVSSRDNLSRLAYFVFTLKSVDIYTYLYARKIIN